MAETPESKALKAEACIYSMLTSHFEFVTDTEMTTFQLPSDFQKLVEIEELGFFLSAVRMAVYNFVSTDVVKKMPSDWSQKQILQFAEQTAGLLVDFIQKALNTLKEKFPNGGIISLGFDSPIKGKSVDISIGLSRLPTYEDSGVGLLCFSEAIYCYTEDGGMIINKKD